MRDTEENIIISIGLALLLGLCGFAAGRSYQGDVCRKELIERGLMEYHSQTGDVVWKEANQ